MELISIGLCACGVPIYASTGEILAVGHSLPQCEKFIELDVLEFLKYVRLSRGIGEA